jgi:hypothetical protein
VTWAPVLRALHIVRRAACAKRLDFIGQAAIIAESPARSRRPVPALFDEIEIGQVISLGTLPIEAEALEAFTVAFAPDWDVSRGAPDPMLYAIWARLEAETARDWPQTKRLGVDALRWLRNPPAGETIRGRMTVMAKDPVGEGKGIVIAQHDLLDEAGRLVFTCLVRSVFAR